MITITTIVFTSAYFVGHMQSMSHMLSIRKDLNVSRWTAIKWAVAGPRPRLITLITQLAILVLAPLTLVISNTVPSVRLALQATPWIYAVLEGRVDLATAHERTEIDNLVFDVMLTKAGQQMGYDC